MKPLTGRGFLRPFHTSRACAGWGAPPKYIAPLPPSPECAKAIIDARSEIFGISPGNGLRSGRKILRRRLKGPQISTYYPTTISELPLTDVGVEPPAREALFRTEQQLNRLGKSRLKGKMRGGTARFQDKMRLQDVQVKRPDCIM